VKLIKAFGLSTMFVLATMVVVGVDSASAGTQVAGCLGFLEKDKNGHMSCVGTYHLGVAMKIKAGASNPIFEGSLAQACGESNTAMTAQTGKEAGTEGILSVTALSFTGECKPCSKVEATGLPYAKGTISMPSEVEDDFVFESGAVSVTLAGCPFGISCKFSAKNAKLKYVVSEGFTSNELRAEGVALERVGGSEMCGSVSKWYASYVASTPSEWWLGLN